MVTCLVEQFKGVINKDNLCTLNGLLLVVPKNTTNFVVITSQSQNGHYLTFTLKGDPETVYFCSSSSYADNLGQTIESANNLYIKNASNEDAYLLVDDRLRIKNIFDYAHQDNVQFESKFSDGYFLKDLPLFKYLYYSNGYIKSSNLGACSALKYLSLDYHKISVDLNDIANISTLIELSLNATNITGNISLLSSLKSIDKIAITYCTGTSGSLESLLEGLATDRVSTNNLDCFIYSNTPNVTFNNAATQSGKHYIVSFNPSATKKITVTINSAEVASYDGTSWTYNS